MGRTLVLKKGYFFRPFDEQASIVKQKLLLPHFITPPTLTYGGWDINWLGRGNILFATVLK